MKISEINSDISEIIKADGSITRKNQLKSIGKVIGGAALITGVIVGGAATSGARMWSRDR